MSATQFELGRQDRARMRLLSEEVKARLQEMARIGARVVGEADPNFEKITKGRDGLVQFTPHVHGLENARPKLRGTKIVCFGSGEGMCICYDEDIGVCVPCDP
jgi:hypothetical protein